jgi:hypothetical protein
MLGEVNESEQNVRVSPRFLTECEVSERTHISFATLRRRRLENRGPKYYKFGSLVRYEQEKLIHGSRLNLAAVRIQANESK